MKLYRRQIFSLLLAISLLLLSTRPSFAGVWQTSSMSFNFYIHWKSTSVVTYYAPSGTTFSQMVINVTSAYDSTSTSIYKYVNGSWYFVRNIGMGNFTVDISNATAVKVDTSHYAEANGSLYYGYYTPTSEEVQAAVDAANSAKTSADNANANAWNAWNALANGPWNNGKSLSATYDQANAANINASNAKTSADTAANRAQTTINQTWYLGKYGGSSESAADIAGYIRNQQLPGISNKIDNLATTINNIQTPTITKVQGQNGATCTTGSTFTVVISATPSSGTSYRVTCGSFDSGWVSNNTITITSVASGANTATVQVKNAAGTTAQTTFTFFKV